MTPRQDAPPPPPRQDAPRQDAPPPAPLWSDQRLRLRKRRAIALAWILAAAVLLIFLITIVKLGGNVAERSF